MIYTNANLINVQTLLEETRAMAQDVLPTRALDDDKIRHALGFALTDLDRADPLLAIRTMTAAVELPAASNAVFGTQIENVFDGEVGAENRLPFERTSGYGIKLLDTPSAASVKVVIRWPRKLAVPPDPDVVLPIIGAFDAAYAVSTMPVITPPMIGYPTVPISIGDKLLPQDPTRILLTAEPDTTMNGIWMAFGAGSSKREIYRPATETYQVGKQISIQSNPARVFQLTDGTVAAAWGQLGTPITFTEITPQTNIDTDQAMAHVIPRAAAYALLGYLPNAADENAGNEAQAANWARIVLARPLPAATHLTSDSLRSAVLFANT